MRTAHIIINSRVIGVKIRQADRSALAPVRRVVFVRVGVGERAALFFFLLVLLVLLLLVPPGGAGVVSGLRYFVCSLGRREEVVEVAVEEGF